MLEQSDQNFELAIAPHANTDLGKLEALIRAQQKQPSEKTRIFQVEGGSCGAILNVGIEAARGKYVVFFDDDGLLKSNWIEEFHESPVKHPGAFFALKAKR